MSDTLQQHHFNAIIYYAGEEFALKMLLDVAGRHCAKSEQQLDSHVFVAKDMTDALDKRPAISNETRQKGVALVEQYNQTLIESSEYYASLLKDHAHAKNQLKKYLNDYADRSVRSQIYTTISEVKGRTQTVTLNRNPWFDTNAYTNFQQELANKLNEMFNNKYTYKPPANNHFIISFLSHPFVRGLNSLTLIGGLAALAIGIIAATGLVTGLPAAVVTALITGGSIASVAGIGLITCSFFRHLSPEEQAARCEKITAPEMQAPIVKNHSGPANESLEQEDKPLEELDASVHSPSSSQH